MNAESDNDWLDQVAGARPDPDLIRRLQSGRTLTPPERRRLDEELALNRLLDAHRPPEPVSSNFTALVIAEITRDAARPRPVAPWWTRLRWLPRAATVAVIALIPGLLWTRLDHQRQQRIATNALEWSRAAALSGLDATSLADFDAVRQLAVAPRAEDDALILALAQ